MYPKEQQGAYSNQSKTVLTFIAVTVLVLWLLPIRSSLWFDEFGTYWIARDSLADTLARSQGWSNQPPLYYLIAWATMKLGGSSEIVMRVPSLLFMAIAT